MGITTYIMVLVYRGKWVGVSSPIINIGVLFWLNQDLRSNNIIRVLNLANNINTGLNTNFKIIKKAMFRRFRQCFVRASVPSWESSALWRIL